MSGSQEHTDDRRFNPDGRPEPDGLTLGDLVSDEDRAELQQVFTGGGD